MIKATISALTKTTMFGTISFSIHAPLKKTLNKVKNQLSLVFTPVLGAVILCASIILSTSCASFSGYPTSHSFPRGNSGLAKSTIHTDMELEEITTKLYLMILSGNMNHINFERSSVTPPSITLYSISNQTERTHKIFGMNTSPYTKFTVLPGETSASIVQLEHGLINSLGVKTPNPHMSAFLWRTMANSVSITLKQMVVEKDYDWVLKDFDEKRIEDISQQGLASVREAPVSDHLPEETIVDSDPEVQDNNRDIQDTLPAGHFNERESIDIGHFSYMVLESSWPKKSDLNFGNRSLSDGQFLMIKLGIRNNDRKPRQIPPLTLVDDSGREYRQSSVGSLHEYSFGLLEVINPNVTKLGVLYFEVPSTPSFRLKVSGGYWSSDYSFIVLTPK